MNKTVNINLAGIFFHIDEDAYAKLQHYLDAIKNSFANTEGRDEIIADIEARIAELFNEKKKADRQVISLNEVEEVIAIMGQPEDYMIDDAIFEDEPVMGTTSRTTGKQLFRDPDNSYIGGVSSGLGHYLGIEAIWVRLLWVLLTIGSSGAFILIYLALWIFVPEAKTTADKLAMRGEEVTISNIEKKIREGFDNVAGKVKDVDYEKYGNRAKSGAGSAATALGDVISFILKLFVKFVGVLILLVAGSTLIALFIGLFSIGTFGVIDAPWTDYIEMANSGAPLWVISILTFFAIGIPFFFLFILGLKILVKNLRSIGSPAKMVLLGIWLLSIIGLIIVGVQQATNRAFDGEVVTTEIIPVTAQDTLFLAMKGNSELSGRSWRSSDFRIAYENDQKIMVGNDIRLIVKSTKDTVGKLEILKSAEGKDYRKAKERAENIKYSTDFADKKLYINSYFTSNSKYGYRDQEVEVTLYLPEGTTLYADDNTSSFHRNSNRYGDILINGEEEHYIKILEDGASCLDCPLEEWDDNDDDEDWDDEDEFNARVEVDGKEVNVKINGDGVRVNDKEGKVIRVESNWNSEDEE